MQHNNILPPAWTLPQEEWCAQASNDAATYRRVVLQAYRMGAFTPHDAQVSADARWIVTQERHFGGRRVS